MCASKGMVCFLASEVLRSFFASVLDYLMSNVFLVDFPFHFCQTFCQSPCIPIRSAHPTQIEKTLTEVFSKAQNKLDLLIIVLPDATGSYGMWPWVLSRFNGC